ncbi:MAG TPA: hypothetical protein VF634_01325 [Pyrinomonadaceae bacterium]|jgi:hypothetical protein
MKANGSGMARFVRLLLASGCLLAGCATFKPSAQRLEPLPQATAKTATTPATPQQQGRKWFADSVNPPVVENAKYGLQCVFKLAELSAGEGSQPIKYVERVVIRDVRGGGDEALYAPPDADADGLTSSQGYFAEVWSPDGEYLVLPLGPSRGFCVVRAKGALETVRQRRCDDFIRMLDYRPVMDVKEVAFFHEWGRWETNSAFSFKAGLHDDLTTFVYDAARGELYDGGAFSPDRNAYLKERVAKNGAREIGDSKKGRVEIVNSFRKP